MEVPQKLGIAAKVDLDMILTEFLKMLSLQTLKVANDHETVGLNDTQGMSNENIEESIIRGVNFYHSLLTPYHDETYKTGYNQTSKTLVEAMRQLGGLMELLDRMYMLLPHDYQGIIDENEDGDIYGEDANTQEVHADEQAPANDLEEAPQG